MKLIELDPKEKLVGDENVVAENGAFHSVWAIAVKDGAVVNTIMASASPWQGQLAKYIVADDEDEEIFIGGCRLDSYFIEESWWGLPFELFMLLRESDPKKNGHGERKNKDACIAWVNREIKNHVLRNVLITKIKKEFYRFE